MTLETAQTEFSTVGALLRLAREKHGQSISEVADDTKISYKNIEAMEADDYDAMPAAAFCRGFYSLYAKHLGLNPEDVLLRYGRERLLNHSPSAPVISSFTDHEVGALAERPTTMPFSFLGLFILLLLVLGGFLAWYFSWNPATFLSAKLRSLQAPPVAEQSESKDGVNDQDTQQPQTSVQHSIGVSLVNGIALQSEAVAASTEIQQTQNKGNSSHTNPATDSRYQLTGNFPKEAELIVSLDGSNQFYQQVKAGETVHWQAGKEMVLTFPAELQPTLTLNDSPQMLPEAINGSITLRIPNEVVD